MLRSISKLVFPFFADYNLHAFEINVLRVYCFLGEVEALVYALVITATNVHPLARP